MKNSKAARKYNLALYDTALELKSVEAVKKDFIDIRNSIANSRELSNFLATPVISLEKKAGALKALFEGKINELTYRFISFLCGKKRIDILSQVIEDYLNLVNEKQYIVLASVRTAVEISDKEKAALSEKLKTFAGKNVTATFTVDPSIRGGFIAKINDRIIDASISRQLELLKEKFSQGSFNN
ncbi:MAG: ATP synthase F1 subunit delta [Ignavibacteria bacterium]|nr:ATP synthase F1 subunit delta [Ignavibacteria bacterium]MCC7158827.1 ATP synthase F1 subunit delta [Ignavibacteria bacterium]